MSLKPVPDKAHGGRAAARKTGRPRRGLKAHAENASVAPPAIIGVEPRERGVKERIPLPRKKAVALAPKGGTETLAVTPLGRLVLPQGLESVRLIKEGMPFGAVSAYAKHMDVTDAVVLEKIGVTGGTVTRRRKEEVLKPEESDRLFRIARITDMAERVLEDPAKARKWLMAENRALGGRTPFSLLDTEPGVVLVEDVLNRIEYGAYS